jgi:hypothetical protein
MCPCRVGLSGQPSKSNCRGHNRPTEAIVESLPKAERRPGLNAARMFRCEALATPRNVCRSLRSLRPSRWQLKDHRLLALHQVSQQQDVAIRKL